MKRTSQIERYIIVSSRFRIGAIFVLANKELKSTFQSIVVNQVTIKNARK